VSVRWEESWRKTEIWNHGLLCIARVKVLTISTGSRTNDDCQCNARLETVENSLSTFFFSEMETVPDLSHFNWKFHDLHNFHPRAKERKRKLALHCKWNPLAL